MKDFENADNPDDIVAAAAAMREAAPEPEKPAEPESKPEPEKPAEEPAVEGEPAEEPAVEEEPRDAKAQADWDAERAKLLGEVEEKKRDLDERERLANERIKKLLEDEAEYKKVREELGIKPKAPAEAQPAGPNPVDDPEGWRIARERQYRAHFRKEGKVLGRDVDPDALEEVIEQDLLKFQLKETNRRQAELNRQLRERDERDQARASEAAAQREAKELEAKLTPLYDQYGIKAEDHEEIEDAIAGAVRRGREINLEGIVRKIAEREKRTIKKYVDNKKTLAAGSQVARSSGGGQAPTPRSPFEELPASPESILEGARRLREGMA